MIYNTAHKRLTKTVSRTYRRIKSGLVMSVVLLLVAFTIVAGCDNLLDQSPRGQLTSESFFQTEEHAVQATNATYNQLRDWNVHVFAWLGATDIISDDATKGSTPTDAAFLLELENLTFDQGNIAFGGLWAGYFSGVYRANVAIQNIPDIEMDEMLRDRLVGENRFLRAYFYYFLVRAYGGVPLMTEPLRPDEFEQPRASADEVYDLIVEDLLFAIDALPEKSEYPASDMGRATRGAAQAMLAHVYLTRGDYQNAETHARAVIDSGEYSLHPDFSFVFTQSGENSSGSIFEIQAEAFEEGGGATQYAQVQGVRGVPNLGWGFNQPSDDLKNAFEPGDRRLAATILHEWEEVEAGSDVVVHVNTTTPRDWYNKKALSPLDHPGGSGNSPVNIRRIRLADVYLIAAEAAYQNGNTADAQAFLNAVRDRARGNQSATLGLIVEDLAETVATGNLGLDAGESRAFVRHAQHNGPAVDAGLQSFNSSHDSDVGEQGLTPVRVNNIDIIRAVNGTSVSSFDHYQNVVEGLSADETVTVDVVRLRQESSDGELSTSSEELTFEVTTEALLPEVTASGQELLEAIWHERRVELAMEQHRWFDINRQDRAAEIMQALDKPYQTGRHELFPIPQSEIDLSGGLMEQNPGY